MENFTKILLVAVGGAFGAVTRYLINVSPLSNLFEKFPFPTFFINLTGSFLIGFLMVLLTDKLTANDDIRLAVTVGFIGAFTTFSTFELEIFELIQGRFYAVAFFYLFLSVFLGFFGVLGGVWLAKKF